MNSQLPMLTYYNNWVVTLIHYEERATSIETLL